MPASERVNTADLYDQLVLGRYRVLEERGKGGFGCVRVCWDPRLMRRVAIKSIPITPAQQPVVRGRRAAPPSEVLAEEDAQRERLLRAALAETRTASMLAHPNIVSMIDFEHDDEYAYIIMEYIEGASLAELLDATEDGLLTMDEAAAVVEGVCDALQFAHENGVLHLDIKPDNILVDRSGRVKLADFGMAALSSATGYAGARGGTVGYMPPEQVDCGEVDVRTDVFAFASVMYEALTGARPFSAPTVQESRALVERGAVDPCAINERLDPALADALLCAVDADPEQRPSGAEELAGELLPLLGRAKQGRRSLAGFVEEVLDDSTPVEEEPAEKPLDPGVATNWEAGPLTELAPGAAAALLRAVGAVAAAALAACPLYGALSLVGADAVSAAVCAAALVGALGFAAPQLAGALGLAVLAASCVVAGAWPAALCVAAVGAAWWYLVARTAPRACAPAFLTVLPPVAGPAGALLCGLLLPRGAAAASALCAVVAAWGAVSAAGGSFSAANWIEGAGWVAAAAVMGSLCANGSKLRCYGACALACVILCGFQLVAGRMENGGSWSTLETGVLLGALGSSILVALCVFAFGSPRSLTVDGEAAYDLAGFDEGGC